MSAAPPTLPGDRYVTQRPCGPQCCATRQSPSPSPPQWIAVRPYSFVFRAPAKGRWLGRGLLELFIHEFAYVPCRPEEDDDDGSGATPAEVIVEVQPRSAVLPLLLAAASSHKESTSDSAATGGDGGIGGATLDRRLTLPAYVEELCEGALWLQGREAECRAAGRDYRDGLIRLALAQDSDDATNGVATPSEATTEGSTVDRASVSAAWVRTVQWLARLPAQADVDALLSLLHRSCPPSPPSSAATVPLVLRQRDTVHHRVWRREGRMFVSPPLQLLRCDVAAAVARRRCNDGCLGQQPDVPALVVVSKPPGLPVHPSGCYRKNSVTSILEDVFGGCDGGRGVYKAEEHLEVPDRPYASIVHTTQGFELIRVFVRPSSSSTCASTSAVDGVSLEDWRILKHLLLRPTTMQKSNSGSAAPPCKRVRDATAASSAEDEARPADVTDDYALKAFVVHRLDAATSGVLLFGLDSDTARRTAVAIANKTGHNSGGGGSDVEDDNVLPAASSQKVYYARVHGRVDLAALAATQHHCALQQQHQRDAHAPASTSTEGEEVLVVQRPIGCVDHHRSLYWCPDAALTDTWQHTQQQQRAAVAAATVASAASLTEGGVARSGKETWSHTPKALAAKHERMRRMAFGSAGQPAEATADTRRDDNAAAAAGDDGEVSRRVQQYMQTLRTATTMLSVVRYDVASQQTVVRCTLGTGRTHQLRVHLASLGHPIVQDGKYMAMESFLRSLPVSGDVSHTPAPASETSMVRLYAAITATPPSQQQQQHTANAVTSISPPAVTSLLDDSRLAHGCVCPDAICLHAWRYVLTYADSREAVAVEVPLPAWAEV